MSRTDDAGGGLKFVDEYRDAELARKVATRIAALCEPGRHYKIMEICGGHTHAIYRYGVHDWLPEQIELVHGPGCPVCVIPMGRVDDAIALVEANPEIILTCFGDMMRVPGGNGSFLDANARGADIRMVYSPLDALRIATENPDRQVVFYAIGFETTTPSTALTIKRAAELGLENFSVFCNHIKVVPAIEAILASEDLQLDAFVGPGHVSTVIGCAPYEFVAQRHGRPMVASGFEPLDLLQSIQLIMEQLAEGVARVDNQYSRVVAWKGNAVAMKVIDEVFDVRDTFEWRGLGWIERSALQLAEAYAAFDAERRWEVPGVRVDDPPACQCGDVLKGALKPWECGVFGTACTPETPIGTCMVSSEGACAAYYNYGRYAKKRLPVAAPAPAAGG